MNAEIVPAIDVASVDGQTLLRGLLGSYQPHDSLPPRASIPFGVVEPKELKTDLPGKIRIQLRNMEFPRAFVRHEGTTRHFMILDFGTHWELGLEHGRNVHYRAAL